MKQAMHDDRCGHGNTAGILALEMTKWFDTNYHYLVPEFNAATRFSLASARLFDEVAEAQRAGPRGQGRADRPADLPVAGQGKSPASTASTCSTSCCRPMSPAGAAEAAGRGVGAGRRTHPRPRPAGGLAQRLRAAYWQLPAGAPKLLLATYFSPLEENLRLACRLPVAGLHVDGVRAPHELTSVADWLPVHKVLSIGIVDGRNIWRTDLDAALAVLARCSRSAAGELWLAPSCSLLHVPFSLAGERQARPELRRGWPLPSKSSTNWRLKSALVDGNGRGGRRARRGARRIGRAPRQPARAQRPRWRCAWRAAWPATTARQSVFALRQAVQRARFALPAFPTTTIGSFPQTADIRAARAAFKRGELTRPATARRCAPKSRTPCAPGSSGLDVLVHGEAERNDMVEYFGEQLDGFAFTATAGCSHTARAA
jgi:5-methyltetrahydropteroyltriglutamate--homocysteine methyltransferase